MSASPSRPRIQRCTEARYRENSFCSRAGRTARADAASRWLLVCLMLVCQALSAQPGSDEPLDWSLCHTRYPAPVDLPPPPPPDRLGQTLLTADQASIRGRNILALEGNIEAVRDGQLLEADNAVYIRDRNQLEAEGAVRYLREELIVTGERGWMDLDLNSGRLENPAIVLYQRHARGVARSARFEDRSRTLFTRMSYTTCDPDNNDWILKSSRLRLDQETGTGVARNVTLSIKGVPVLYSPYLSFPIDDRRKSGFLSPSIGDSSKNGIELEIPYYLNLGPSYDATLTPRFIDKRGVMLESEFRYLTRTGAGALETTGLRDDDLAGRDRYLVHYHHVDQPLERLNLDLQFNRASDGDYFRDLGNSLSIASITHLDQHALLNYQTDSWTASARLQAYQTIDETIPSTQRPYRQLPILVFRTHRPEYSNRLNARFVSGYVNFRHDDRLNGGRLDLQPGITLPFFSIAAYAQPSVTLRYTSYQLDEQTADGERNPQRGLPVFTFDSGLFLERDTRWGSQPMLQTLEPRLYYLYIPYRDQSDLPLFDTGLPDFNFTQLFRQNRFNGSDRIGDANQLSAALTTRFLEANTGRQRLEFSIGQIYYFQDREVTLSGPPETAAVSDVVAEGNAYLTDSFSVKLDARRSEETGKIDKGGIWIQYRPALRSVLNVSYRYRDSSLEQSDVSLLWPLGARWHLIGRHNYSFHDERVLETLAGLEYQSCCWRLRLVSRRYVDDDLGGTDSSLHVQFDLKGLTSLGSSLESLLENGILGYRD